MPDYQKTDVDLAQVLSILRRQALVILACCALSVGSAVGLSVRQQKLYVAKAALLFTDPDAGQALLSLGAVPQRNADRAALTNLELVALPVIAVKTAKAMGGGTTVQEVHEAIGLEPRGKSDLVEISATHPKPAVAASIANTFAQQYIDFRRTSDQQKIATTTRTVDKQISELRRRRGSSTRPRRSASQNSSLLTPSQLQLATLVQRATDLRTLASVQTGNAEVVQAATVPSRPSSPKPKRNALIALFAGLLLGLLLALVREQLNRRITTPEEYAEVLDVPLVGTIPVGDALARRASMPHTLSHLEEEGFRMLHGALRLSMVGDDAKIIIVTSALPAEGKSTVALHLAATACSLGERVLLVDADFHRPGLHNLTKLPAGPGLPELLVGVAADANEVLHKVPVVRDGNGQAGPQMDVLTSGNALDHPRRLLSAARVAEVIKGARPAYDRIVIDTAPATVVSDPIALMQRIPAVVLVVARMDIVTQDAAKRLHRQITTAGAEIQGVVANFVRGGPSGGYYYAYGPSLKNGRAATRTEASR